MYGNHFTFEELTSTQTGLYNCPVTDSHLGNLASLWNTLNYLRNELGRPIVVNSAFRSPEVNKAVNGAKRSLHMQGRAADIRCAPEYMADLWRIIEQYDKEVGLSEKIKYDTFFHIAL